MSRPVIGVGWDVGGWMGKKQGVAAIRYEPGGRPEWVEQPRTFGLPEGRLLELEDLIAEAGLGNAVLETHDLIVAVDSPFGFPKAFGEFLRDPKANVVGRPPTGRWIESPLAFRETDRIVHQQCGKRPLSPVGDALGNNATVAMAHLREWASDGMRIAPFDGGKETSKVAIEVYPALAKRSVKAGKKTKQVVSNWFGVLLPDFPKGQPKDGSDQLDAAICALLALCFAGVPGLPSFAHPTSYLGGTDEELAELATEGWIYFLPEMTRS